MFGGHTYILASAGERTDGLIYDFKLSTLTGFKDKLFLNAKLIQTNKKTTLEKTYPYCLIKTDKPDTREVIPDQNQTNLMVGLENDPAKSLKALKAENIKAGAIINRLRKGYIEATVGTEIPSFVRMQVMGLEGDLFKQLKQQFKRNDLVIVNYIDSHKEQYLQHIEKVESITININYKELKGGKVVAYIGAEPREFIVSENLKVRFKSMKKDTICNVTLKKLAENEELEIIKINEIK
ncbi:protease complex subunit PrcB family protein [Caminicella sporogenes]|uniref:protease complex subunit PrcB family protein n=1 Tax=Caminicella sporogenes TaxID=166485 RepID=UPI0025412D61|nr:protease complex subunit PrcB family protein [Caminicella sporogenes]WIF94867.1 protease complex subunit PrcB family protein [Caminicella sporogenes]